MKSAINTSRIEIPNIQIQSPVNNIKIQINEPIRNSVSPKLAAQVVREYLLPMFTDPSKPGQKQS